jgi:hypothetical protein
MSITDLTTDTDSSFDDNEAAQAYAFITPEILALQPGEILRVTLDIPRATTIVLGAAPHIAQQRDEIARQLSQFPLALIDNLPKYARGARYAHHIAFPATLPRALDALLAEGGELRETLLTSAEPLVLARIFDATAVADVRSGTGNLDRANDLSVLGALYASEWTRIAGRTLVTEEQVRRAGELGGLIFDALAAEAQPVAPGGDGLDKMEARARAYTVFFRAYGECRRAIAYVRAPWGDAEAIAPTLFSFRRATPKAQEDTPPVLPQP